MLIHLNKKINVWVGGSNSKALGEDMETQACVLITTGYLPVAVTMQLLTKGYVFYITILMSCMLPSSLSAYTIITHEMIVLCYSVSWKMI